ncbi:N-acetylmuramoyl-L-alanine amidase family protein [Solitalea lacus]|uniref:N-acetylmuramoyl-L-alanine amidase family protein n=1 Tax=Solitalea lacus TaxID=2911172 RepID=UPI001EDBC6F5|nr:N-acetylmuramoyl-L-alanine amidase [Solitalea lacus]UKJ06657.1 N-acetylmuramoyl-L-alanine amidase [Solitalea lacus]
MQKRLKSIVKLKFALSLLLSTISLFSFQTAVAQSAKPKTIKTIIIDPGHGYPTLNAKGRYSYEADLTLSFGQALAKKIQDSLPDCKVLFTRNDRNDAGGFTSPREANRYRARFANDNHGDLFISLHCNWAPGKKYSEIVDYKTTTYYTGKGKKRKKHTQKVPVYRTWNGPSVTNGTETFIWAVNKNDSKVQFVQNNTSDSSELHGEHSEHGSSSSGDDMFDSPEARIIASLMTKKFFDQSLMLADLVQNEFTKQGRVNRGVKQRNNEGIWVLQATAMPSILVEAGFVSNPDEEDYMNSEKGKDEIATAIIKAIMTYKRNRENGVSYVPVNTAD